MKRMAEEWLRSFETMPWILRAYLLLIVVFYAFLSWALIRRWRKSRKNR